VWVLFRPYCLLNDATGLPILDDLHPNTVAQGTATQFQGTARAEAAPEVTMMAGAITAYVDEDAFSTRCDLIFPPVAGQRTGSCRSRRALLPATTRSGALDARCLSAEPAREGRTGRAPPAADRPPAAPRPSPVTTRSICARVA
jgi:hypothetical protein